MVVSDDVTLGAATRREFEHRAGLRVAAVSTVDAAQTVIATAPPAVILVEETALPAEPECKGATRSPRLTAVVSALILHAPVVVIAEDSREVELTAFVNAGAAHFVPRGDGSLPAALGCVKERLRQGNRPGSVRLSATPNSDTDAPEAFGAVLRHELNNPLTGILGNAELLLAEVRRKNDGRLPRGGQQRLETIAELAVRLRETVRRLSEDWETRNHAAS